MPVTTLTSCTGCSKEGNASYDTSVYFLVLSEICRHCAISIHFCTTVCAFGSTYLCFGVCGLHFSYVSLRKVTVSLLLYSCCFCWVSRRRKGKMLILIRSAISHQKLLFLFIVISLWFGEGREINLPSVCYLQFETRFWSFLTLSEIICLQKINLLL